ncbi:MAG: bifunctional folylpolyglutamate synthase/dihydrofolate synthase [Methanomassiliicoccaceae archaeon]|nr:bifunctional folylpolyglutamate synthase/dihydrofolate synthase [Methanomassiliicoccaceae archaeon]
MKEHEWIYGLGMNRMRFGLESITELLRRLGDPQKRFRSIHVAGSDGKGSTCAMIYSILLNAGVRAGMYTSPHLIRFGERISVLGKEITDRELDDIAETVRPEVERMISEGIECTFFEAATATAFLHFSRTGTEYAVLETGMGGRLDATNTIIPEVTAITNVSMEHSEILGDTVEKIASEKAGIIKKGVPVVTANRGSILDVIKDTAKKMNSEVVAVDVNDIDITSFRNGYVTMRYAGDEYKIGIPGKCQSENAAIAIECSRRIGCDGKAIGKGLKDVRWRGRMEYFPDIDMIIDVTHTAAGAERLAEDVLETYGKVILILGMFGDKDADGICEQLAKISSSVIITRPGSERAMPSEELAVTMRRYFDRVTVIDDIGSAIDSAKGKGTVLVTGSLHMAGEAISYLKRI